MKFVIMIKKKKVYKYYVWKIVIMYQYIKKKMYNLWNLKWTYTWQTLLKTSINRKFTIHFSVFKCIGSVKGFTAYDCDNCNVTSIQQPNWQINN